MRSASDTQSAIRLQVRNQPTEPEEPRHELRQRIQGIRELPDGFALLLAGEPKPILTLLELFPIERLVRRFSSLGIATEPEDNELWVRFTGRRRRQTVPAR